MHYFNIIVYHIELSGFNVVIFVAQVVGVEIQKNMAYSLRRTLSVFLFYVLKTSLWT